MESRALGAFPALVGPYGERDELEAVDVDEAEVGDLQRRDHRQGEEGQHLEGVRETDAERLDRDPGDLDAQVPRHPGRQES